MSFFGFYAIFILALPVTIAVAPALEVDAVEHKAHVLEFLLLIECLEVGQLPAVETSGTDHKEGDVGDAVGDGGIGDDAHGHAVGNDGPIRMVE